VERIASVLNIPVTFRSHMETTFALFLMELSVGVTRRHRLGISITLQTCTSTIFKTVGNSVKRSTDSYSAGPNPSFRDGFKDIHRV